jgi:hypothetical protein
MREGDSSPRRSDKSPVSMDSSPEQGQEWRWGESSLHWAAMGTWKHDVQLSKARNTVSMMGARFPIGGENYKHRKKEI